MGLKKKSYILFVVLIFLFSQTVILTAAVYPFQGSDVKNLGKVSLFQTKQTVTKKIGKPSSIKHRTDIATGEKEDIYTYKFGKLYFSISDNSLDVVEILKKNSLVKGPRNTQVGDSLKTIMGKFYKKSYPIKNGMQYFYNTQKGNDYLTGYAEYKGKIITHLVYNVELDGDGGSGYKLDYEIKNSKVSKITVLFAFN